MGWTPADVGRCSLWRFKAAVAGWKRFNRLDGADKPAAPSEDEFEAAVAAFAD